MNGYLEGYDYDIVDGEVVYDTTKFDPPVTDPFMPGKSTILKNSPSESVEMYLKLQAGEEQVLRERHYRILRAHRRWQKVMLLQQSIRMNF